MPILLLTARGEESDRVTELEAGAVDSSGSVLTHQDLEVDTERHRVTL